MVRLGFAMPNEKRRFYYPVMNLSEPQDAYLREQICADAPAINEVMPHRNNEELVVAVFAEGYGHYWYTETFTMTVPVEPIQGDMASIYTIERLRLTYGGPLPLGPWPKTICEQRGALVLSGQSKGPVPPIALGLADTVKLREYSLEQQHGICQQLEALATYIPDGAILRLTMLNERENIYNTHTKRTRLDFFYKKEKIPENRIRVVSTLEKVGSHSSHKKRKLLHTRTISSNFSSSSATQTLAAVSPPVSQLTVPPFTSAELRSVPSSPTGDPRSTVFETNNNTQRQKRGQCWYCDVCGYGTSDKSNLRKHLRIHKKDKRYICKVCSEAFSDSSNLRVHQKRHDEKFHFACRVCGARFSAQNNLKAHAERHIADKKVYSGPCALSYCKKFGEHYSDLLKHLKLAHEIPNILVYNRKLLSDMDRKITDCESSRKCFCPDHSVWIYKWVGQEHNCYLCECRYAFYASVKEDCTILYGRFCQYSNLVYGYDLIA